MDDTASLSRGNCVTGAAGLLPEAWTGTDQEQNELAAVACRWCPALEPCRAWLLSAPGTPAGVVAGLTADQAGELRGRTKLLFPLDIPSTNIGY